jgi:UPF0716 protein FxsA
VALLLAIVFVIGPIIELTVIVAVAREIGVLETIGLLILVSIVGVWLCKREGLSVLRRLQLQLERRETPHRELVDGLLILFGGLLLIVPGFVTDVLGLVLLLPPTRTAIRSVVIHALTRRGSLAFRVIDSAGRIRAARVYDTAARERTEPGPARRELPGPHE